jgi:hypothetical protein
MQLVMILNSNSFQLLFHLLITVSQMYSVLPETLFYDEIQYKPGRYGVYTVRGRIFISKKHEVKRKWKSKYN